MVDPRLPMPVDPAALREAIHGFTDKGEPDERNVDLNVLLAAAREFLRLMETAETVWWCEAHRALESAEEGLCEVGGALWNLSTGPVKVKCRMVEAVLTVRRET